MSKRFAVFDIDGTLFRWQLFHELVFELAKTKVLPRDTEEKIITAQNRWRNRESANSFHTYEMEVVDVVAKNLKGVPVQSFHAAAEQILARSGNQLYTYTRDLLKELKQQGYVLLAISGSFEEIVAPFAKQHGFDDWRASTCEQKDGHFTGVAKWMALYKTEAIKEMVAQHQLSYEGSIAVGDTKSDIPLLEAVEQPIAFNPSQELLNAARQKGWKIVVERKNVIYELVPGSEKTYTLL